MELKLSVLSSGCFITWRRDTSVQWVKAFDPVSRCQYSDHSADWTVRGWHPGRGKRFFFSLCVNVQTGYGPHPASASMSTGFLSRGKAAEVCSWPLNLVHSLGISGAMTTLPLVALWHGQGQHWLLLVRVFHGHQSLGLDRTPEIKRPELEAEYSCHPRVRLRMNVAVLCCFSLVRCFHSKERTQVTMWCNSCNTRMC